MLELRCPKHPQFRGDHIPGSHGLEEAANRGGGGCGDCWELFRQKQAEAGNLEARK